MVEFERRITLRMKQGWYLECPVTGKDTGFLLDESVKLLERGKVLCRSVIEFDGQHGFDMSEWNKSLGLVDVRRGFVGRMKDLLAFDKYPFELDANFKLSVKGASFNEGDIIKIVMKVE